MELTLNAKVTLDATPALVGALDRMADALKGGGNAPKPRAKAAKSNEPEQVAEAAPKAPQEAPAASAAVPAAAAPATPTAAVPPVAPAAVSAPTPSATSAPAAKGISGEEARRVLIAIVQKHACADALQNKLHELGYQTQYDMPDDVRADFVAWVRQTYPISDAEVF